MNRRVSLSDIARKVGCSISTVSLSLRGNRRITRAVRERIHRTATRMGYRPNSILASFASSRFKKAPTGIPLAFIAQHGAYSEAEKSTFLHERTYAAELGYDLQLFEVPTLRELGDASRMLHHRGIEGVILSDFVDEQSLPSMDWNLFAVVALGGQNTGNSKSMMLHRATADHSLLVRNAWLKAIEAGYRRIGLLLLEHESPISDDIQRHSAGLFCLSEAPRGDRIPILRLRLNDKPNHSGPVAAWMRRHRPEVVIGFNEYLLWPLKAAGWTFPDSMAYIALMKDPLGHGVAGFNHNREEIFRATIELIDFQVRHRLRGIPENPRVLMIGANWSPGESLPPKVGSLTAPRPGSPVCRAPHPAIARSSRATPAPEA